MVVTRSRLLIDKGSVRTVDYLPEKDIGFIYADNVFLLLDLCEGLHETSGDAKVIKSFPDKPEGVVLLPANPLEKVQELGKTLFKAGPLEVLREGGIRLCEALPWILIIEKGRSRGRDSIIFPKLCKAYNLGHPLPFEIFRLQARGTNDSKHRFRLLTNVLRVFFPDPVGLLPDKPEVLRGINLTDVHMTLLGYRSERF